MPDSQATLLLPAARAERWVANFHDRHGHGECRVVDGLLTGVAEDGSHFAMRLPFDGEYDGPATPAALAAACRPPEAWGVLLVRKGGFAVARMAAEEMVAHKVGQRHVQGRTKAGGQSQQRFARRRANQAREAYRAAAEHAARVLAVGPAVVGPVVVGGDHGAVETVLTDPRLADLRVVGPWLSVPEPRRAALDTAVEHAQSLVVDVHNA